jgi:hypothetical protein
VVGTLVDSVLNVSYLSDVVFSCLLDDLVNSAAFVDVYQVKSVLQKGVNFIISTRQKHVLTCYRVRD